MQHLPCDANPSATMSAAHTSITLLHALGEPAATILVELVERFRDTHPGIDVELVKVDSEDLVLKQWRETDPDARPSLALMPQDAARLLADSGTTAPVGDCLTRDSDDLLPAVAATYEVDGVMQAVPFSVSTPVLLYNRYVFEKAGLDPDDPPETLDELRAAAEQVEQSGAGTGFVFETGPQNGGSWFVEQWLAREGELSLDNDNGRSAPATSVRWDSPLAAGYLAWLRSMVADGVAENITADSSVAGYVARLVGTDDPAAMMIQTCGSLRAVADLAAAAADPTFDPAAAPMPGPGGEAGGLTGGNALFIASGLPDAETAAAWELASFLASAESQATLAARTGYVPVRTGAAEVPELAAAWSEHPMVRTGYDQLAATGTDAASVGPQAGPERELKMLLAAATTAAVEGADPEAALSDAARAADALLRDYARHVT